ncbi:MAG: bifunctional diaminohydroxyphosphoribosylaminopyrimidine deaminase/5-amino-6-(5-phosphoribosylamino)uracil reductase RibD [Candidatus Pacebacteria bacterium]|nr:bifunctional diaminohydroxyphosphoribosylaminopyrimidine deaminase/5-amino-6-(5-phosphoribosylamino)uracil reductase RibD [Candidatus Paceibacterota bacterium]
MTRTRPGDRHFLQLAIDLGARQLGRTWPNPAVGCVIVQPLMGGQSHDDPRGLPKPIAFGATGGGGRPHAETLALAQAAAAGYDLHGATVFVSLEPCCHQGKTPPCTDALIKAGVGRVVIATLDPDPRVSGGGVAALQQAGVEVEVSSDPEVQAAAGEVLAGYMMRQTQGRPLVTVKLAVSLDSRIATADSQSKWITGPESRAETHRLRACHDAIMVGTATVLADSPRLDCRLPGMAGESPIKVILDRRRVMSFHDPIFTAGSLLYTDGFIRQDADEFSSLGVDYIAMPQSSTHHDLDLDLDFILQDLGQRGFTSLLVEGGARLATSLLKKGLIDRLVFFRAPMIIGAMGKTGFDGLENLPLADIARWQLVEHKRLGDDVMEVYKNSRAFLQAIGSNHEL